jgi:hypothetical protein
MRRADKTLQRNATGGAGDKFHSAHHSPDGNSCRIDCRNCTYVPAPWFIYVVFTRILPWRMNCSQEAG